MYTLYLFNQHLSTQMYNHYTIVAENSVTCPPPDGFFGIQIIQNQFWPGLRPGSRCGSLRCSSDPRSQLEKRIPSYFPPLEAFDFCAVLCLLSPGIWMASRTYAF